MDTIENFSNFFHPVVWNLLVVAFSYILGIVFKYILVKITGYYNNLEKFSFVKSALIHLGKPLNFFLPLFVFELMLPLMIVDGTIKAFLYKTTEILLIVSFSYILINLIKVLQDYFLHSYGLQKDDNLKERKIITQLQFVRKFLIAFIVLLTIAAILFSFEGMRKLGAGLLTSVGIGGIIIGFAAQKSLGNLLAGFQIAFTQPLRIDDVLIVEGEYGRVEEITLTYVVLNLWDQRKLILPITYFIEKPFQNWTRNSSEILGTVFIYADHSAPIADLRIEFERLLAENVLWDKRVQVVQVTDVKESTIEIRFLMSASNASKAFDLRCYIRENMIKYIQSNYPESLPRARFEFKS